MRFKMSKLEECNRRNCGCGDMLHFFYKKYHFFACPDAENEGHFLFCATDGKNKTTLTVKKELTHNFEDDFEKEIIESVQQLKSIEVRK